MAHFAELNENNKVINVIKVHNNVLINAEGVEEESKGIEFLNSIYGHNNWKQTDINTCRGEHKLGGTPFRKNYAGYWYDWNEDIQGFTPPKLHNSWILNEDKGVYEAPIPMPEGKHCIWDEENGEWSQCENIPTE